MLSSKKVWVMLVMILVSSFNTGMNKKNYFFILIVTLFIVANCQSYQTMINISPFGFEFQPSDSMLDVLNIFNANSYMYCYYQCHAQPLCCSFDFDSVTNRCRLFVIGKIISSLSSSSQVGTIRYSPDLYIKYNQTCTSTDNNISRYLVCGSNNTYQCLPGF